jgi:4-carboxymuconolactone decarboxylase
MSEDRITSRFDHGMRTRRAVLGDAYVDRVMAATTSFDARFQEFITEAAWGTVWAGQDLDRRTRSLITIALLAALGRDNELTMHIRACRNTGATPAEIREALMHVAVYAGVPAAKHAMEIARTVLAEGDATDKGLDDRRGAEL